MTAFRMAVHLLPRPLGAHGMLSRCNMQARQRRPSAWCVFSERYEPSGGSRSNGSTEPLASAHGIADHPADARVRELVAMSSTRVLVQSLCGSRSRTAPTLGIIRRSDVPWRAEMQHREAGADLVKDVRDAGDCYPGMARMSLRCHR